MVSSGLDPHIIPVHGSREPHEPARPKRAHDRFSRFEQLTRVTNAHRQTDTQTTAFMRCGLKRNENGAVSVRPSQTDVILKRLN